MAVSKERLRTHLEAAMEDVAMLTADTVDFQQRLREIRQACAEVWQMAELGDVPEWEMQPQIVRVSA